MARKARESDLQRGKAIHYWGENWQVWNNDGEYVTLVAPGHTPGGWYRPYPGELTKPTSTIVSVDNEFLLCFDDIKKDVFGKEIK
ncbi:MAG TPA: hypothetical protein VE944_19295 [Nostoc sp.]|uniref:hypothetical protein n=1 Tax=Nostoc sp. TaxID=1180 RepID=UPI002D714182|nr:hypothetical protein [Nostoc sp.]HYX16468.1 hypothetical protein [Nostoc sp.]